MPVVASPFGSVVARQNSISQSAAIPCHTLGVLIASAFTLIDLNFPTDIAKDLITSYQERYLNNQSFTPSKGLVISLQENLVKTKNAINYFTKNRELNPLTNRSTAFS